MSKNVLFALIVLTASPAAMACPHNLQQFICPGDPVVDSAGNPGTVDAVNPFQKTVAINYGGASDGQSSIETVALGVGCLAGFCVGDSVVDSAGNRGKVVAVNPYNNLLALNYGGASDGLSNVSTVALGMGCMLGYCVGDGVVDSAGNRGTIDAINYSNSNIAVNYGGASDGLSNIETLSSTNYCSTYGDADRTSPLSRHRCDPLCFGELPVLLSRPVHN